MSEKDDIFEMLANDPAFKGVDERLSTAISGTILLHTDKAVYLHSALSYMAEFAKRPEGQDDDMEAAKVYLLADMALASFGVQVLSYFLPALDELNLAGTADEWEQHAVEARKSPYIQTLLSKTFGEGE